MRQDRIETCDYDSPVELDQVLEDQVPPPFPARMHRQSTFRKPAKLDRRDTESFRKRTNLRCGAVVVARQEHDSPATVYGRVLVKDGSDQMVEAFHQPGSGEHLRDESRGWETSQFLKRGLRVHRVDDDLPLPVGQRSCDLR